MFRPADGPEVAAAWNWALSRRDGPVVLALTRQKLPPLGREQGVEPTAAMRGGYTLWQASSTPEAVVLATGAEVHVTVEAAQSLAERGIALRVVSMPCAELFAQQDAAYRESVLGPNLPCMAVEMGRPEFWCQFTGSLDKVVGMQTFGASAPAGDLAAHFGFTSAAIAERLAAITGH